MLMVVFFKEIPEFDLHFEKCYKWTASRVADKEEFMETLFSVSRVLYCVEVAWVVPLLSDLSHAMENFIFPVFSFWVGLFHFTGSRDVTKSMLVLTKQQNFMKNSLFHKIYFYFLFLVSYVGERPWWPILSLNKGRKKKAKG